MASLNPGPGRLPSLENLLSKNVDEIIRTLQRFGLEPDINDIGRAANRAFEKIDRLLEAGQMPDEETLEAIRSSVVREITGLLRKQVKGAIRDYKAEKMKEGGYDSFTWIAVVLGSCPSCLRRHGKTKTMKQWQAQGLPGDSVLLCGEECRCQLVPSAV